MTLLSNKMLKVSSYRSNLLSYIRRLGFGFRCFISDRGISCRDFLKFFKQLPTPDIRLIAKQDIYLLKAHLLSAPYRTHQDDLNDQDAGSVSMAIVWLANHPVGQGIIHWSGPREPMILKKLGPIPEIFRLYVRQELRSQGIGTHLVQFLEHLARNRGHSSVGIGVSLINPKAQTFYERIGYTDSGIEYTEEWSRPGKDRAPVQVSDNCKFLIKDFK